MTLTFYCGTHPDHAVNVAYLISNNWDDFCYKTLFKLVVFDAEGERKRIGNLKIGFVGQDHGWTSEVIPGQFNALPENFYSLGQDADYYKNIVDHLSQKTAIAVLVSLRDVVHNAECFRVAEAEDVFSTSLMRSVSRSSIEHQFKRILNHEAPLTDYKFFYEKAANERYSGIKVEFTVEPDAKPSSNIHILIGRNGVGKTTLLNSMVDALLPERGSVEETGYFASMASFVTDISPLDDDYFAGIVSISFSAFDPFLPPPDQSDTNVGLRYYYVGLKKRLGSQGTSTVALKEKEDLCRDFIFSLRVCFSLTAKQERWSNAVMKLESDFNFAAMELRSLVDLHTADETSDRQQFSERASALFMQMSSGHAIVLLTITKLIETVEEKTLVLIDEPESHLHPPLLSAFTRALSDLLINRNGVAIVATHSPVVLQEVPKSCVSILRRSRLTASVDRPEKETFAENVGVLTREVFGLEVSKSGFHSLLETSVAEGRNYEDVVQEYQDQLGFEGRAILRSMILMRDADQEIIE